MEQVSLINNTSVYRYPDARSPLQGANVMQPAAVYDKIMLRTIELAEQDYVFDRIAQERTMPSNNGANEIVFKRMLSLAAHTQPLVEGIPPASDQGRMVAIKGSTKQYGRVMKFTDKVDWAVVDPLISEYTRQLSLKIPETKDLLAQEALLAECQTFYAQPKKVYESAGDPDTLVVDTSKGIVSHIRQLSPDCNPTLDEFRKIVLSMEAAKVRPFTGGNFAAYVSSAVMFDLITDHRVKEFMKYTNSGAAYSQDVVIDLFSLAFKKAKTIKTDNTYTDGDGVICYLYRSATNPGTNYVIKGTPLAGAVDNTDVIKVTLSTGATTSVKKSTAALPSDLEPLNVHHSLIIGDEALFRIGVQGHTAPKMISKQLGSAGTEDPLDQRQSIGWKIDSLGYKVVNPDAVVDYMSIPTQFRINMHSRPDLKNEFTDYFYGYVDASGKYYHPEQVTEFGGTYKVKGTNTNVTPIKMTQLVKPVGSGKILESGKKPVVIGSVPSAKYMLKSDTSIRFRDDQVVASGGKFYIKGLADVAAAEVVSMLNMELPSADGSKLETRTVENTDTNVNKID